MFLNLSLSLFTSRPTCLANERERDMIQSSSNQLQNLPQPEPLMRLVPLSGSHCIQINFTPTTAAYAIKMAGRKAKLFVCVAPAAAPPPQPPPGRRRAKDWWGRDWGGRVRDSKSWKWYRVKGRSLQGAPAPHRMPWKIWRFKMNSNVHHSHSFGPWSLRVVLIRPSLFG